jgi:adenine-specific DNA-methyltransferase
VALIDALLERISDRALRDVLRQQIDGLLEKKSFGLVYQPHKPETVHLPSFKVKRGCKVAVRGEGDTDLYTVTEVSGGKATIASHADEPEYWDVAIEDLVVVREFGDPIYPGLRSVDKVERGGDKPTHVVINAENFHALELLLYTHENKIDAIYIDPPYNTGNHDWKYNNDYVDGVDRYRHSKWLAFMEKRLLLAKRLLNPDRSVLICTIDDNEVTRLGMLIEQVFPESPLQLVTTVINPRGQYRDGGFSRCEEYLFIVTLGTARVAGEPDEDFSEGTNVPWRTFRRSDLGSKRGTAKGGTNQFYPIYVDDTTGRIHSLGAPLRHGIPRTRTPRVSGCTAVFPIRDDGTEMNWGLTPDSASELLSQGYVRVGRHAPSKPQPYEISYLTSGRVNDIKTGRASVVGYEDTGAVIATYVTAKLRMPLSTWSRPSHNAEKGGTELLKALIGEKAFPYPKSLYAVEDTLRFFIGDVPNAVVLDFFGGSGTTTHAVARLNRQDGGRRQSILVTNNEVSEDEAKELSAKGLFPGDKKWEALGIAHFITWPRVAAALTGKLRNGRSVAGDYRWIDESPISDGLDENAEFFELTYEDPDMVSLGRRFSAIAPLLWLKAGGQGPRVESVSERWALPDGGRYGVLFDVDSWREFVEAMRDSALVRHAFIVTDSDAAYQQVVAELPGHLGTSQLYSDYLRSFEINTTGRA